MDDLTERQTAILTFISRHCRESGYPPTVREIGLGVGLASPSTVHAHLAKLESAGHIRRDPTKPRAMFVCRDAAEEAAPPATAEPAGRPSANALPLVGSVAAGVPMLAEQDVEDWISSPFEGDFMLRVTGDSMINAGILDGDLVVVAQRPDGERRGDRRRPDRGRGDGQAPQARRWPRPPHARERRLLADRPRRGDAPRRGRGGAAQALTAPPPGGGSSDGAWGANLTGQARQPRVALVWLEESPDTAEQGAG